MTSTSEVFPPDNRSLEAAHQLIRSLKDGDSIDDAYAFVNNFVVQPCDKDFVMQVVVLQVGRTCVVRRRVVHASSTGRHIMYCILYP